MARVPEATRQRMAAAKLGRSAIPVGKRRYLVHLRDDADPAAFAEGRGIARERIFIHAIKGFVACLDDATVNALRDTHEVQSIEEDRACVEELSQIVPNGVKRMAVEQFPPAMIDGQDERVDVDVAVMESGGVQPDHPDLNVFRTHSVFGNFNVNDHATAVAGVIGALDNAYGTVGVVPGARIWSVSGISYMSDMIAGFDYVAEHADEIEVVNCSFVTRPYGASWLRNGSAVAAVRGCVARGVVVVCGAGNDAKDIAGPNGILDDGAICDNIYPAGIPESMAISAINPIIDQFASYSNYSASNHTGRFVHSPGAAIDVAAPTNVATTVTGSGYTPSFGGTSCATPHASGLVALYIALHGRATDAAGVYRIRQAIVDAAHPQGQWQSTDTLDPDSNPEGLAQASLAWGFFVPPFTSLVKNDDSVTLGIGTLRGYEHVLQHSDSLGTEAAWAELSTIAGDGTEITVIHPYSGPRHFYRLATRPQPWPLLDISPALNLGSSGIGSNGLYYNEILGVPGALPGDSSNTALRQSAANANGFVRIPYHSSLSPDGPVSIEIWVKPTSGGTGPDVYRGVFASSRDTERRGWLLSQGYSTSGNLNGFTLTCEASGSNYIIVGASVNINPARWYHIVGVIDGTSVRLYVDGALAASATIPAGQSYRPNLGRDLLIGGDPLNGWWFDGDLDEAAIYPFALSAAQVQTHYQAGINPSPPVPYQQVILNDNPAGYWRFNEE